MRHPVAVTQQQQQQQQQQQRSMSSDRMGEVGPLYAKNGCGCTCRVHGQVGSSGDESERAIAQSLSQTSALSDATLPRERGRESESHIEMRMERRREKKGREKERGMKDKQI